MEPNNTAIDYNAVLADLKKKRDELDKAIAGIEVIIGLAPNSGVQAAQPQPSLAANAPIPEDAFFGMSIVEAANKYLQIKKKPQTTKQIAEALEAGGLTNQSGNFGNTVGSVLNRNVASANPIFANISRGTWGLSSWYGNRRPKTKNGNGSKSGDGESSQDSASDDVDVLVDPEETD